MVKPINRIGQDDTGPHGIVIIPAPAETMDLMYFNDALNEAGDREGRGEAWEMTLYSLIIDPLDTTPKVYLYGVPALYDELSPLARIAGKKPKELAPRYYRLMVGNQEWRETTDLEALALYLTSEHTTWVMKPYHWGFVTKPIRYRKPPIERRQRIY